MSVHRIRLNGPWEYAWCPRDSMSSAGEAAETALPPTGRVQLPREWRQIFGDVAGETRFTRVFHRPTGLEPGDVVRLIFAGVGGKVAIQLNGESITPVVNKERESGTADGNSTSLTCEITSLLQPANRLVVEVEFDPNLAANSPGGLFEPVTMEIVAASE